MRLLRCEALSDTRATLMAAFFQRVLQKPGLISSCELSASLLLCACGDVSHVSIIVAVGPGAEVVRGCLAVAGEQHQRAQALMDVLHRIWPLVLGMRTTCSQLCRSDRDAGRLLAV